MLSDKLRICLLIAVCCYFVLILLFLKRKAISLKYTLLWIAAGIVMATLVVCPDLLVFMITIIGIESNMNGLFIMAIAFLIAILMSITSIVSRQAEKIKSLTQTIGMLEKELREIKQENLQNM